MESYASPSIYIESASSLEDKVTKIDVIINGLLAVATASVGNMGTESYSIDDGQSKIATKYRSSTECFLAIKEYEKLKNGYLRLLNGGGIFTLKDRNSLC